MRLTPTATPSERASSSRTLIERGRRRTTRLPRCVATLADSAQADRFPPQVHLQLYDEVCHDLPLFSFTTPAKYCFRAMASFAKWVTTPSDQQPSAVSPSGMTLPLERDPLHPDSAFLRPPDADGSSTLNGSAASIRTSRTDAGRSQSVPTTSATSVSSVPLPGKKAKKHSAPPAIDLEKTIYSSTQPFNRPEYVDNMIRERISTTGVVRPLEPEDQMSMLKVDKEDVGLIKEAPVKRYLAGSESSAPRQLVRPAHASRLPAEAILERKFRRTYKSVQKEREREFSQSSWPTASLTLPRFVGHLKKSMREEAARITKRAKELAKQHSGQGSNSPSSRPNPDAVDPARPPRTDSPEPLDGNDESAFAGLGGAWDLHGENPPPSSLAGRKDTVRSARSFSLCRHLHGVRLDSSRPASSPRSSTSTTAEFPRCISGPACVSPLFPLSLLADHRPCSSKTSSEARHARNRRTSTETRRQFLYNSAHRRGRLRRRNSRRDLVLITCIDILQAL